MTYLGLLIVFPSGSVPKKSTCLYSFDITHTLDEVFEAAPVIKHILSDECSITRAFVGTA